ncbi:MAG: hypothetical protein HY273_08280 [Gammaproteobacteria bacterium]|nr:hypothetical protein [Gammaproteobacteria bacterium]
MTKQPKIIDRAIDPDLLPLMVYGVLREWILNTPSKSSMRNKPKNGS